MTNPDNVGGLPTADQLYDIAADAWDQHQTNCRVTTTAGSLRKAVEAIRRELCRADPAGSGEVSRLELAKMELAVTAALFNYEQGDTVSEWLKNTAALLRKLQQGADGWRPIDSAPKDGSYVLVANSHGSWIARWHPVYQSGYRPSNPWMSMMLNHDHIEKPGRYDLPSQWRPIPHPAASQGQEGGA